MLVVLWPGLAAIGVFGLLVNGVQGAGETPNQSQDSKIHVKILDPQIPSEPYKNSDYVIHEASPSDQVNPPSTHLPSPQERDKIFRGVGISSEIEKMDELDRDLLWNRAHDFSNEELIQKYPQISPKKLSQLQSRVKK